MSAPFSDREIADEGIKPEEYKEIVRRLGRHPNKAELGMFGVMWSEHCCYKNSRPLLKQFPTTGERILVGPGENAGVVDLGDGLRLAFKIESHNHPSAVEPFQGAATGVGGILRDIFTMGARPIAILNSLRFGSLDDAKTRRLFAGVVEGIAHYGNCVGVPTVGGEVYFDPVYSGNPLVNAMALGLMETPEIIKSGASGIGNPVLYVGSTTGRDGMGGASFASAELSDQSIDDRPAVQVGDPFLEKSLIEACLEAFKTGAVVAAQDMGAAGITCSTSEMAAKGGVGIELDLDKIPVRETGMIPYEYLLSESQERMLFVARKGREGELIDIFHRWGLHAVVAGTVIEEPIVRILFKGEIAAEIPATALAENTPIYHRELLQEPPEYARKAWEWTADSLPPCNAQGIVYNCTQKSWNEILLQLLDTPTIASKRWVYRQYDHQVQNNTVIVPGGADAAVIRVRPVDGKPDVSRIGVAATTDCNARYVYLDPYEGAKAAVAEAARNLSCVGAEPLAVTDNLNFGSPENPIGYWQLASACRGISEACRELKTPVTGGNVSLYNETLDSDGKPQPIYPTPVIGMVGLIPDITKVCGQGWKAQGDSIYLLGVRGPSLGGSEYLATVHGIVAGQPPVVDFELERRVQEACRYGIRQGWINSAHDCAEGGLAVALAECCISGRLGADIRLPESDRRFDEILFGEAASRIVVSVNPQCKDGWESYLNEQLGNNWRQIGAVTSQDRNFTVTTDDNHQAIDVTISNMIECWTTAIERRLKQI
ncbi:phosphoribosylformylglycinamidine synthase II [Pleurocapsa sp. PCC 7327]|uniref:phosphoribosylformylglycinamidine synthase subunit PurL n=1 Tax=Pleurocapsa sp. PCC 7327 TaxID=118163 RepID=UPI00029FE8BA|nr:phosphoribosylformylglycinamidine synthase subunit PurL [Pleurocapsa sp. PCC 7327]AFY77400.1 phosphoribosylformylglycinamidine synthase II [Pleurocapsa sp. PCC 7327]